NLLSLEHIIDKHFAIVGIYQSWGEEHNMFNAEWAKAIISYTSIPLITWEPWKPVTGYDRSENTIDQKDYRLANIIAGNFDKYITQYADAVTSYKKPLLL